MMDVVKAFFNGLNFSSANSLNNMSDSFSAKSDKNGFESYLNSASNKVSSENKDDIKGSDKTISKYNTNKANKNENINKADKNENVNQENNNNNNIKDDSDYKKSEDNVDKNTDNNIKDNEKNDSVKNNKSDNIENELVSQEIVDSLKQKEIIENLAKIFGVSAEEVQNVLNDLGISALDLFDSQNFFDFVKNLMGAENLVELLNVEGIKDMISEAKDMISDVLQKDAKDFDLTQTDKVYVKEDNDFEKSNVVTEVTEKVLDGNDKNTENSTNEQTVLNSDEVRNLKNETEKVENNRQYKEETESEKNNAVNNTEEKSNASFMNFENNQNNSNFENLEDFHGSNVTSLDNVTKAFSETLVKTEAHRNVNQTEIINQIVQKMKAGIIKENISELKITLKPDYLGEVSLKVISENGIVSAQFNAENQKVKEIIESNFNQLKDMLNEKGIEVSEISVSVDDKQQENMRNFSKAQNKSSKRINNIIESADFEEIEKEAEANKAEYLDEGVVLETNINYTA